MSGTAKFFVVINLILSLFYLGATAVLFGYREDFKKKYLDEQKAHQEAVKTLRAEIDEKEALLKTKDDDIRTKNSTIMNLESEKVKRDEDLKRMNAQFDDIQAKVNDLEEHVADLKTQVDEKDTLIKNLSQDKEKLTEQAKAAEKAKERALAEQRELQSENTRLREQLANLEKNYIEIAKKAKEQQLILEQALERGIDIGPVKPIPIDGKVSAVRAEWRLVMINIGQKDGVQKGMPFVISRGPHYVGKIIVDEIYPDMAAGMILTDQTPMTPQVGDDVRAAW